MEQKTNSEELKMIIKTKSIFEKESGEDGYRVCVMRFIRNYYKYDLWLKDLAPSIELLNDWKDKKVSWKEYEERYLENIKEKRGVIGKLLNLIKEKKVVTLLCCERDDRFCHGRLLKEYLENMIMPRADAFSLKSFGEKKVGENVF